MTTTETPAISPSSLWDTLTLPWQICLEEAWQAYCAGSLPIGAAITDAEGAIVARGRNRRFDPQPAQGLLHGTILAHAEVNALLALDRSSVADRYSCTIYTTTEPCPLCVGAITLANVRTVCYAARDPWAGSSDLFSANHYMSSKKTTILGLEHADLEIMIVALWVEFVLRVAPGQSERILPPWQTTIPLGMLLGEQLFRDGALDLWRSQELPAQELFARLAAQLRRLDGQQ